jgi:hypoxia up-regulated 1
LIEPLIFSLLLFRLIQMHLGVIYRFTLFLVLGLVAITQAAVMSIDFGSEFFKVALVKPGIPMEVVLNPKESKRKTENLLVLDPRSGAFAFGAEAAALSLRYPNLSYPYLKTLLGRHYYDPVVKEYKDYISPADPKLREHPKRKTVVFEAPREASQFRNQTQEPVDYISVEELIAIILRQAKFYAEHIAGEEVKEAVIAVPRYFTHHERLAMLDTARLAGLRVLELINEDTAMAIQFALSRNFQDHIQHHIFFDMGAGSMKITMARFSAGNYSASLPNVTKVELLAFEHDPQLNGRLFDKKLQIHLAETFEKATNGTLKVKTSPRAMAKLLHEAKRVKETLTINTHTIASVENLLEDTDLKVKITREEFEDLIRPSMKRVQKSLNALISKAGISLVSYELSISSESACISCTFRKYTKSFLCICRHILFYIFFYN